LTEKFNLYPRGCFVLASAGHIGGYCFSHPWMLDHVPAMNTFLGALPERPTTYYVHDLTLDAGIRGQGFGRAVLPSVTDAARTSELSHLSLVAVNNREPFWRAAGFSRNANGSVQAATRDKYGEAAVHMHREL
jgi:GNAT superfamily N-acetyltransferase